MRIGEYTTVASLGDGAYGTVYRAVHDRSGATVAIKLLHSHISERDHARAATEARAIGAIHHPNVVHILDLGVTDDRRPYLVLEYVDGQPLRSYLPRAAPLAAVLPIALDVLAGVDAAHRDGIVHRDLKPENILVAPGRGAVVLDFGLAKVLEDPAAPHLMVTGQRVGTPRYMAPEQIRGEPTDPRVDVYAIGTILYELLAGEPPFPGEAIFALFEAHLTAAPPPLAPRARIPARVAAVIERALAKDPARRFATAGDMRRALVAATAPRRAAPIVAAVVAVAAIVGIGLGARALATPRWSDDRADRDPPAPPAPYPVPPAERGLAADPSLERTLESVAGALPQWSRATALSALCPIHQVVAMPGLEPKMRSFYQRYELVLLEALPGEDPARLCRKP